MRRKDTYAAKQKGIDSLLADREERQERRRYYSASDTQWVRDAIDENRKEPKLTKAQKRAAYRERMREEYLRERGG